MTNQLIGTARGATRAKLIDNARKIAATYYETGCVDVAISDQRFDEVFVATFAAVEYHDLRSKPYGPPECRGCGKDSWPQRPLPTNRAAAIEAGEHRKEKS